MLCPFHLFRRSSILSETKTFFGPKYNNLTAALREEELLKFQKLEMAEKVPQLRHPFGAFVTFASSQSTNPHPML